MRSSTFRGRVWGSEGGVTIVELMIAILVLTVGLLALAQMMVVATMSNTFAVNASAGVQDAQRFIEAAKLEGIQNGFYTDNTASLITSGQYNATNDSSAYYRLIKDRSLRFKETVWVYKMDGSLETNSSYTAPVDTDVPTGTTSADRRSPSANTRRIYIRLDPIMADPRYNQSLTFQAIVVGDQYD